MTTYFIADHHFGHKNILKFEPKHRPYPDIGTHDEFLIKAWNDIVNPQDLVWHLGDFSFGLDTMMRVMNRLNGRKKLVLGNHDQLASSRYLKAGFEKLHGVATFQPKGSGVRVVLSHVPLDVSQTYRYDANIHGHVHSKPSPTPWHVGVSVERCIDRTGLPRPMAWEELLPEVRQARAWAAQSKDGGRK